MKKYFVSVSGQVHMPFDSEEDADSFAERMQQEGFDVVILEEEVDEEDA